jgi:hypothetical protein
VSLPLEKKETGDKKKMDDTVAACIDLTSHTSIAGQTLDTLSVENKEAFKSKIQKNLKKILTRM